MAIYKERYINPLTDFGFKRLFGSEPNKDLLIDFLNVLLPLHHRVKDLDYRNSCHSAMLEALTCPPLSLSQRLGVPPGEPQSPGLPPPNN
jgi:hypothetical protein